MTQAINKSNSEQLEREAREERRRYAHHRVAEIARKRHQLAIKISRPDFVKEHKHLIGVLRSGSRSKQEQEAKDQSKELKQKE
jgi:hypothetical protein